VGEDWELNHVGLMVTNKNAVLRYLQSIGVGVCDRVSFQGSVIHKRALSGLMR
jgi:hypothetical protein